MTLATPSIDAEKYPCLRMAMCQTRTAEWDLEGNFDRLVQDLNSAGAQEAELAITPECGIHGYGFGQMPELKTRLAEAAEPLDGVRIKKVKELAKQYYMDIVFGFAEKGTSGKIFNSAALITNQGEIEWVYRKVHCRDFESTYHGNVFTPGEEFFVSRRSYRKTELRLGVMICFDREITETVRCLRALGAELIACPLATDTSRLDVVTPKANNEQVTAIRAAENEVFIAVVNHSERFNGGSFVVGPAGEAVVQLDAEPTVDCRNIPVGIVQSEYHSNPLGWMGWGFRREEVYKKYL